MSVAVQILTHITGKKLAKLRCHESLGYPGCCDMNFETVIAESKSAFQLTTVELQWLEH